MSLWKKRILMLLYEEVWRVIKSYKNIKKVIKIWRVLKSKKIEIKEVDNVVTGNREVRLISTSK